VIKSIRRVNGVLSVERREYVQEKETAQEVEAD
jgi:hypothetical protein